MLDKRIYRWEKTFSQTALRLAGPIVVQCLVMALMHIVDNLMIGWLGESQLAGVTQANRITFLMQVTMFGVVSGASIFTAQYWGRRDIKGIHRTLGLGMSTAMVLTLLFALPAILVPETIIRLLIHEAPAVQAGTQYLRIIGFAYLIQGICMVQSSVLKSTEYAKLPMVASICAIVCNSLLNWMLIFGNFGFPRLEVEGAAIATLIGSALELALLLSVSYIKKLPNAARLKDMAFTRQYAKAYFKVVLPTMTNECIWSLGMVVFSAAYGLMGQSTVAAVSIFNSVEQMSSVVIRGATHACSVMVGMYIGSDRNDEANLTAKRMLLGSVGASLLVGLGVMLVSGFVVAQFNVSASTAQSANELIRAYGCILWVQAAASMLIVGILRAGGDVTYAMVLDVVPQWLLGLPVVFLLGPVLGLPIFLVFLVSRSEELVKVLLAIRRMNSGKWIHNLIKG